MKLSIPIAHNGDIFDEVGFRITVRDEWCSDLYTRHFSQLGDACSAFIIESHKNKQVELNCQLSGVDEEMSEVYGIDLVTFHDIAFTSGYDYVSLGQHYCVVNGFRVTDSELMKTLRNIIF